MARPLAPWCGSGNRTGPPHGERLRQAADRAPEADDGLKPEGFGMRQGGCSRAVRSTGVGPQSYELPGAAQIGGLYSVHESRPALGVLRVDVCSPVEQEIKARRQEGRAA